MMGQQESDKRGALTGNSEIKWGKLKRRKARIERMKELRASDKTWTGELIESK